MPNADQIREAEERALWKARVKRLLRSAEEFHDATIGDKSVRIVPQTVGSKTRIEIAASKLRDAIAECKL